MSVRVTLVRSRFGRSPPQTAALAALGLKRIGRTVSLPATASTLANVRRVVQLVRVELPVTDAKQ